MGLFGGGSSSSSQVVNKVSNVTQGAQDGGLLINLKGGNAANGASTSVVNITDSGSIERAFNFGRSALDTTGESVNRALTFAQRSQADAIDFASDTADQAFNFSGDTVSRAFGFGRDSFNFGSNALDIVKNAFATQARTQTDALGFSQRAGENALKFAYDAGRPDAANTRMIVYVAGGVAVLFVVMSVINNKSARK